MTATTTATTTAMTAAEQTAADQFNAARNEFNVRTRRTDTENQFWTAAAAWTGDRLFSFEFEPANYFHGGRYIANTFSNGCFLSLTLNLRGGLSKKTACRSFGQVDGKTASFWGARQTRNIRKSA